LEVLVQDFAFVVPHLPVTLCYILLNLPYYLKDENQALILLINLVEGFFGVLHLSDAFRNPELEGVVLNGKTLMTWLEGRSLNVLWFAKSQSQLSTTGYLTVEQLVDTFVGMFQTFCPQLIKEMTLECLQWAMEPKIGAETTLKAIRLYYVLEKLNPDIQPVELEHMIAMLQYAVRILSNGTLDANENRITDMIDQRKPSSVHSKTPIDRRRVIQGYAEQLLEDILCYFLYQVKKPRKNMDDMAWYVFETLLRASFW
jgi:hypothetical protein